MQVQNMPPQHFWTHLTTVLGTAVNLIAKIPSVVELLCITLDGKALRVHRSLSSKMCILSLPWPTPEVFSSVRGGWFYNEW